MMRFFVTQLSVSGILVMDRVDVAEDILRGEEKLTKDKPGHLDCIQNDNHYRQGFWLRREGRALSNQDFRLPVVSKLLVGRYVK